MCRTLISFLFLHLLLLFLVIVVTGDDAVESDRSVLLQFKNSVSDPAGMLSSWNPSDSNHCSWFGVSCDANSRVSALNISGELVSGDEEGNSNTFSCFGFEFTRSCLRSSKKLAGNLSPSIRNLTELRVLSIPYHELHGEVPLEIWDMEKLEVLDLEGNSLNGTLPLRFGGLRKLRVLNLRFNKIEGEIPDSISSCKELEIVILSGNLLKKRIPVFFGNFSGLRGLYLAFNQFDGRIPNELGSNCWNLEHLDLSGNSLLGGIPPSLGNCGSLRSLLLFSNLLEETIPPSLGQLTKLEVLDVSRNCLSGSVPAELGNCVELSVLVLSNMYDPLQLVENVTGDQSLGRGLSNAASDDYNYFQGGIPVNITTLRKLRILWAPRAILEGEIPSYWGACDSLEMVNLGQNYFTGEIPKAFGNCRNLHFLDLSANKLTGLIDEKLAVPCMTMFDISGNRLSGLIPRFVYDGCRRAPSVKPSLVRRFDPSYAYSSFFTYRAGTGISLPSFGSTNNMEIFHNFGDNSFMGPTPSLPIATERLGNQTVYAFLVGGNKLGRTLPDILYDKCDHLNGLIVNFSYNQISGQIPADFGSKCRSLKLLNASGNQISGVIPESFGNLSSLVGLDLSRNKLYGQIPAAFGWLKSLTYLSLAANNLTGPIPSSLGQLSSLEVLKLSSNSLSGEIPRALGNLRNLTVLLLDNNKLSGQIPSGFRNVSSFSLFDVSLNNLSGPILRSGSPMPMPSFDKQGKNGQSLQSSDSSSGNLTSTNGKSEFNPIEIASITSACAIVSVLLALIFIFFYTRKCNRRSTVQVSGRKEVTVFTDIGTPLTYEKVVRGTGIFNATNCIGSGGFGATYKAEISPGVLVAIKKLSIGRIQGVQQFHAEIKTLGRMRHPNLVTLIGYHLSETEMFLIYNYLPGGNLENFIQERSTRAVDWRMLHKIALDVARALAYLHDQCVPRVLHRDVKPSNILLDNDFNAYLSDFGLARLLSTSETHATTGVAGTFGYVAPEYAMTCRVSDKADVYSYGVVLLELISDKKALDPSFSSFGNGFNIVAWACMLLRQGRAREVFAAGLWDVGPHDDLVETLHLAVMCTVETLSIRPTMKQVVQRLKQLQPAMC